MMCICFCHFKTGCGVYIDFSKAIILGHPEEDFIQYMQTSADDKGFDPNYAKTWENNIKPDLIATFCGIVNDELSDNYSTRFLTASIIPTCLNWKWPIWMKTVITLSTFCL